MWFLLSFYQKEVKKKTKSGVSFLLFTQTHTHLPTTPCLCQSQVSHRIRQLSNERKNLCAEWGDGYVLPCFCGEKWNLYYEKVFPWDHSLPLFLVVPYLFGFAAARPASTAHVGFTNFHKLSDPSAEKRNGAPCNQKINVVKKKISIFQVIPNSQWKGIFLKWKMGFTTNWAIRTM